MRLAVLYGSGAAGRLAPGSDLDVGVAAATPLSADRRGDIARALAKATRREVDLLDLTAAAGPILHQALTTGRVVLCREQALHASLMRRMIFDEADLGPLRRRLLAGRRSGFLHGRSPALDRRVIDEKLESLRRCLARVEAKVPATAERLAADPDAQDIVVLNLERAVQTCVDVGTHLLAALEAPAADTMADTFTRLEGAGVLDAPTAERMIKAVGFRNLAVHAYAALDWVITHRIATEHLGDFRAFARAVDAWAAAHP